MSAEPSFDAVILAAGASRRLRRPKQLVTLWGRTLLERSVALAQSVGARQVHVVLGAGAPACRAVLTPGSAQVHVHPDWRSGQASTLALGLASATATGTLVLVCDQYRLRPAALAPLVGTWRDAPQWPVAAGYAGAVGVPVVWPRATAQMLAEAGLTGRDWLAQQRHASVPVPEAAYDLDTPEDLAALRAFEANTQKFM